MTVLLVIATGDSASKCEMPNRFAWRVNPGHSMIRVYRSCSSDTVLETSRILCHPRNRTNGRRSAETGSLIRPGRANTLAAFDQAVQELSAGATPAQLAILQAWAEHAAVLRQRYRL